ncbi:hypothetical protein DID75_05865, partial [Candidatus Marinamargulisbacteria bacterium SCGC AG-410-N11]
MNKMVMNTRLLPALIKPSYFTQFAKKSLSTSNQLNSILSLRHDSVKIRQEKLESIFNLRSGELAYLNPGNDVLDRMSENVFQGFTLPFSVATHFLINDRDYLVPMAVEEPSIVAASSHGAKITRKGNGFRSVSDPSIIIGQIQLIRQPNSCSLDELNGILTHKNTLDHLKYDAMSNIGLLQRLIKRNGGFTDYFKTSILDTDMAVFEFKLDVQDAMGANMVNTVAEYLAPRIEDLTNWKPLLRILSNNAEDRTSTACVTINFDDLTTSRYNGQDIAQGIVLASKFALFNENRAVTHNKG